MTNKVHSHLHRQYLYYFWLPGMHLFIQYEILIIYFVLILIWELLYVLNSIYVVMLDIIQVIKYHLVLLSMTVCTIDFYAV